MGKTGKWFKSFLGGKKEKVKDKEKEENRPSALPTENQSPAPTKEKRRWSFRRSAAAKDVNSADPVPTTPVQANLETENEQKKHALVVAATTAAAADAAVAAAQAAAAVNRLTTATTGRNSAVEEADAIKIQSVFRSFLARKALRALKGLVKLQALVRGHLVRKQATATLRCMQALVTVQARTLAQRTQMTEKAQPIPQRQSVPRRLPQDNHFRQSCEMDRGMEENIKIVEMDLGESRGSSKSRNSYSNPQIERAEHRYSTHYAGNHAHPKLDPRLQASHAPSALTDLSPRACSGHFEEYSFTTAQSSPHYFSAVSRPDPTRVPFSFTHPEYAESITHDYYFPNYMTNTESSRAKVRSQSAPKQRPEIGERQPNRRRPAMEGRNIPRGVRMRRSSSHVCSTASGYQYPWLIKLDQSTVSLKDSECGSTSTVLTSATNYCKSLVAYEAYGNRY